jgi:hypothetical protein
MPKSLPHPLNSGKDQISNPKKKLIKPITGWRREMARVSRWLHIYLSMVSFAVLLFFAVTGLTLNHADKWGGEIKTRKAKGTVNAQWVNRPDTNTIAKLEVVEYLRKTHHIKGSVDEFRTDERECTVAFKGPGYSADVFITRETGEYELAESRTGLLGIINDLHKGRDTGSAWSLIIDISAILMTLVSLSGIILICFIRKRRFSGLVLAVIGTFLAWFIYALWVP